MRKNIYSIIIFLVFITNVAPIYSQTKKTTDGPSKQVKPDDAKEFKKRQLLVVKTGEEEFDSKLRQIVNQYWNLHENIQFVSYDELNANIADNPESFGVLTVNQVELTGHTETWTRHNKHLRFSVWLGERINKKRALYYQNVLYNNVPVEEITKTRVFTKDKNEYSFDLDHTEILFAVGVIQNHLKARIEGKPRSTIFYEAVENSGKLETKTLLIAKSDIDKSLEGKNISEYYPYPYKLVSIKEIEEKFLAQDKNYAYVEIVPFGYTYGINSLYVVDCENGELLSFGEQHNGAFDNYSNLVSKNHLERFVKNSHRGKKK